MQRGFITMFKVLTFCELNSWKNSIYVVSWSQFRGKETHWENDLFIYFMPELVFKVVFHSHCSNSKAHFSNGLFFYYLVLGYFALIWTVAYVNKSSVYEHGKTLMIEKYLLNNACIYIV